METFLSIVIPAFNASSYIERCLNSIFDTLKNDNDFLDLIEVVVVDDCSIDDTYNKVINYKSTNNINNLKLIKHPINRQQGAARNTGIRNSEGRYIWFVDVDDYIDNNVLTHLIKSLISCNADVIQFNAQNELVGGERVSEEFLDKEITGVSGVDYLNFEAEIGYSNRIRASWSKWYRRMYLIENDLFFQEGIFWEDVVHTLKSVFWANTFLYLPVKAYIYVQTPNSDMRGAQNGRKFADTIRFCVDSFEFLLKNHASNTIINFQKIYYEKVLAKYKLNLHKLSFREFLVFNKSISKMNTAVIEKFCGNKSHNWLNSSYGRFISWLAI